MAEIEVSPKVADHFVRFDWHNFARDPEAFRASIIGSYERGKVILLDHPPFAVDFDVLQKVSLPPGRTFQKLSDRFFTRPKLHKAEVRRLYLDAFGTDLGLYLRFRGEVRRLSAEIRGFLRGLFRPYRFLRQGVSWRFTRTGPEGLHVDDFKQDEDLQHLRLFMNVDREPRVWTVSHPLEELIDRYYEEAKLSELLRAPCNDVCRRLNKVVFDRVNALPRCAMDRHVVTFAPGDVWLCETRLNSHEIYSGHRMVATDFYVDPSSMLDPSQRVEAWVGGPNAGAGRLDSPARRLSAGVTKPSWRAGCRKGSRRAGQGQRLQAGGRGGVATATRR